ncbi:MAG: Activator of Hsp90 ATPase 1 family protein [Acidobacteria bacterium]|nr:Activator of Hsp90 ATPase 1 family protein [Acidobacteriota bacterium]
MIPSAIRKGTRGARLVLIATLLGAGPQSVAHAAGPVTVTRVAAPERALRFEVTVPASLDQVWAAFTTSDGLATWLWRDTRVDARPGGDWLAIFPQSTGGGTILSITPKTQLVIAAMAPETFPAVRAARTRALFEFAALTPASTRVSLVQTGWQTGEEWDQAYDYLAAGNAELLTQLYRRFASGPLDWPKGRP